MKNTFKELTAKGALPVRLVLMGLWLSNLLYTNSYFSVYVVCAGAGLICLWENHKSGRGPEKMELFFGYLTGFLLSLATTLANYQIFQRVRDLNEVSMGTNQVLNALELIVTFAGGITVFSQIFFWAARVFPKLLAQPASRKHKPAFVFWSSFALLLAIYLVYLFAVVYPGNLGHDSFTQIRLIAQGSYNNHHPFWHTMCIKLFMSLGYGLFGDVNAATAVFHVFQGIAAAASFSYAVVTLYQYGIGAGWVLLTLLGFAALPCHITYSGSMWKDVPFGLTMLVLVVAMFRILRDVGKKPWLNWLMLAVGGLGSCLMRTNGWYAIVATLLLLLLFFRKVSRRLILPMILITLAGWLMLNPLLDAMGVKKVTFLEGLSVPLQQVARVIAQGGELTPQEEQQLGIIMDLDQVPELYQEYCCDPVKYNIRDKNLPYLQEHKGEYLRLWLNLGLRYPWEYVEAWVEETKGYWNGGYDYYIYAQFIPENEFGIHVDSPRGLIFKLVNAYFTFARETILFQPIQSIGLNIWVLSMLCFLTLMKKRKEFLLTVPVLAVVFTLWLTTPVFSEFRYAYCVFTTLPFLLPVSLYAPSEGENAPGANWT